MAPEVIHRQTITDKTDVYSFGLVLWELAAQTAVFPEYTQFDDYYRDVHEAGRRPALSDEWPAELNSLLRRLWLPKAAERPSMEEVIPTLQDILWQCLIPDEAARQFWKNNFDGQKVPWKRFVPALFKHTGRPLNREVLAKIQRGEDPPIADNFPLHCMRQLVEGKGVVQAAKFGEIASCFGPFDPGFLLRVVRTLNQPYFFGPLSAAQAHSLLCNEARGTYLARFSSNGLGFSLSLVSCGADGRDEVIHLSVHRTAEGGHRLEGQQESFPSLPDLIDAVLSTQTQRQQKEPAYQPPFRQPCPKWPYRSIFQPGASGGGYKPAVLL